MYLFILNDLRFFFWYENFSPAALIAYNFSFLATCWYWSFKKTRRVFGTSATTFFLLLVYCRLNELGKRKLADIRGPSALASMAIKGLDVNSLLDNRWDLVTEPKHWRIQWIVPETVLGCLHYVRLRDRAEIVTDWALAVTSGHRSPRSILLLFLCLNLS